MEQPTRLVRQLGLVSAVALVVSNMVGTGIFSTSGFLANDLAEPKIFFGIWIVGAIVSLAGALCYSELGVNFPSSGGEYVYLSEAYGKPWGFMTGWASLFAGFSAPIAAAALACASYLAYFFPALRQDATMLTLGPSWFEIRLGGAQLAAGALIGALTLINVLGVALAARFQNVMTAFKIGVLLTFIVLGLAMGAGDWSHFSQPAVRGSTVPIAGQFAISLCFIYMAYSGWNAATYIAEELKNPAVTLPRALTIGTLLVAGLFLLMNAVYVYAVPLEEMKGVLAIGSLASTKLFGEGVAGVFSLAMAVSLVPTVNAMMTIGPRVYYAMAKNGAFLSFAGRVDPKRHTPVPAIVLQGTVAILMTLTPFPSLLTFIGLTLNFFTAMSVASLFLFRRRPGWKKLGVVSFAWPAIPVFFCSVGLWVSLYGFLFAPRVSFAAAAMLAAGALAYHLRTRGERQQPAYGD